MSDDLNVGFDPALSQVYPDQWTAAFWDAAREHRLIVMRCADCQTFRHPPTPFCWKCRSRNVEWVDLPGTGTVYTFMVARHALTPAVRDAVPYVVAVVALDGADGVRLITDIVGIDPDDVAIDLPVEVVFEDVTDTVTMPRFRPRTA